MRILPLLAVILALAACSRDPRYRHDETAREAGRQAYRASQDVKRGAREAGRELKDASREFREGWEQARREHDVRKSKPTDADRDRK